MLVNELLPSILVRLRAYELERFQVHMLFDGLKEIRKQKIGSLSEPQRRNRHKIMLIGDCVGSNLNSLSVSHFWNQNSNPKTRLPTALASFIQHLLQTIQIRLPSSTPQINTKMLQLIVGDDNAVRGMLDSDGKQRFSVYDCLTILFLYNVNVSLRHTAFVLPLSQCRLGPQWRRLTTGYKRYSVSA